VKVRWMVDMINMGFYLFVFFVSEYISSISSYPLIYYVLCLWILHHDVWGKNSGYFHLYIYSHICKMHSHIGDVCSSVCDVYSHIGDVYSPICDVYLHVGDVYSQIGDV
jgi:hypothetical protein